MVDQEAIRSFIRLARRAAAELTAAHVEPRTWVNDNGPNILGWRLSGGDYRRFSDEQLGRNPYYMGGSWGDWDVILGADGMLYEHQFRGRDEYSSTTRDIVTTLSNSVIKKSVGSLAGRRGDFQPYRDSIESLPTGKGFKELSKNSLHRDVRVDLIPFVKNRSS